jgi:hypothetical protein
MTAAFRLEKVMRFLCDLGLGGGICGLSFYVIWIIWLLLSPVIMGGTRQTITGAVSLAVGEAGPPQSLPVSPVIIYGILGVEEAGFLQSLPITVVSNNTVLVSPRLGWTVGEMQFQTSNWRMQILFFLGMIIPGILYLGILYLIRQFLVDAMQGIPFALDNAQRLKWIGWLLLGIAVVKPALNYLTGHWILSAVTVQGPMLSPWIDLRFIRTCVLVACFSLILSVIFRHGVELEKEHSLTV